MIAATRDESTVLAERGRSGDVIYLFNISLECAVASSGCEVGAAPVVETFSSTTITWHINLLDVRAWEITIRRPTNLATFGVFPHSSKYGRNENGRDEQENERQKFRPKITNQKSL